MADCPTHLHTRNMQLCSFLVVLAVRCVRSSFHQQVQNAQPIHKCCRSGWGILCLSYPLHAPQRIAKYEAVYETIRDDKLSYIKLINLQAKVSGVK
jgi:hypothetical protein